MKKQFFLSWLGAAAATGLASTLSTAELYLQTNSSLTLDDLTLDVFSTLILMVLVGFVFAGVSGLVHLALKRPALWSFCCVGLLIVVPDVVNTVHVLSHCDTSYWICYVGSGLPRHGSIWLPNGSFVPDDFHFWKSVVLGWAFELGQGAFIGAGAYTAVRLGIGAQGTKRVSGGV